MDKVFGEKGNVVVSNEWEAVGKSLTGYVQVIAGTTLVGMGVYVANEFDLPMGSVISALGAKTTYDGIVHIRETS